MEPTSPTRASLTGTREREYVVVARRYRPQSFDDLVGQGHVGRALSNAIQTHRVGHAYLFTGARGVGKTSTARILAKALNCERGPTSTPCNECDSCVRVGLGDDVDVLEIDGASNRGIDEIRELRQNVNVRPSRSRFKIYIIDEVHMLTGPAFNALLKTLEEPPEHVKFIFCTTEAEKIPVTIVSRCQRFDFAPIQTPAIVERLNSIVQSEGATAEPAAIELLSRRAAGSMRDAQSLLEQLLSFAGNRITAADVHRLLGTADDRRIAQLVDQVVLRNAAAALAEVDAALAEGVDCGQLLDQLLGYFRDLMVLVVGGKPEALLNISASERDAGAATAGRLGVHTILAMMQIVEQALTRLRYSLQVRIVVEMTIVRLCSLGDLDELPLLIGELRGDSAAGNRDAAPLTQGRTSVAAGAAQAPRRQPPASARPDASNMSAAVSTADSEPGPQSLEMQSLEMQRPSAETRPLEPETVDQLWRDALATITDMTADHASLAEQLAIDEQQRLVVVFPAKYTSSRNFCERPERRQQIEKAVAHLVGRHVQIVFQLGEEAGPQSLDATRNRSGASPWERLQQAARHPLIRRAAELFDARPTRIEETGR